MISCSVLGGYALGTFLYQAVQLAASSRSRRLATEVIQMIQVDRKDRYFRL